MNKKQKMWLALLCLLFWTCTDLSPFGDSEELVQDSDPALVKLAKEMLQRSRYELSLPDIHKHHSGSASTRSLKYDTDVSPLWDKARSYQHGESKTLLVPLRSADEIRSRIALRRGSDVTYQFAKAKSFLVLQQVKGYTISRVMTYLPESSYAEEHVAALDTIGYNAGAIGFHGLSIVSKVDGTFSHAFLYEHGKITRQFIRNAHLHCNHEHGEECHHESDSSTYEHTYLTIDLYTPSSLTRGGYDDGNENGNEVCPDCGKFKTDCFCIYDKFCYFCQKPNEECTCDGAVIEGERCNECGEYLQYCVCCGICGFHPCQCDDQFLCPTCKKEPCECTSGSQGGKDDGKEEGGGDNENEEDDKTESKEVEMTEEEIQLVNAAINFLKNIGVDISNVKIVKVYYCAANARVSDDYTKILVCSQFFKLEINDRAAVLFHENCHLKEDNRSWTVLNEKIPIILNPTAREIQYITKLMEEKDHIDRNSIWWEQTYKYYTRKSLQKKLPVYKNKF